MPAFYEILVQTLQEDPSLTLKQPQLEPRKEEMYQYLINNGPGDGADSILFRLNDLIKHPDLDVVAARHLDRFKPFLTRQKFYNESSDDSYKFAIRMPGLLLQTNSNKIEGAQAGWELSWYDFFFRDYRMTAESRKVNTWAFVVAGILALIALAGLITALLKKR